MKNQKGFTLVELLVVISIIAILSIIGLTIFTGVQKGARDARRRADIDAIVKAMEVNYGRFTPGEYSGLCQISSSPVEYNCNQWFANDLPKDPINNGSNKYCLNYHPTLPCNGGDPSSSISSGNPAPNNVFVRFCALLESGSDYCLTTSQ